MAIYVLTKNRGQPKHVTIQAVYKVARLVLYSFHVINQHRSDKFLYDLLLKFHRLGQWQESLHGITDPTVPVILQCYEEATVYDSNWYKAWHAWAVMNFEACLFYRHRNNEILQQQQPGTNEIVKTGILSPQMISKYAVPALKGFVRSITLSKGNSLQGKLRKQFT